MNNLKWAIAPAAMAIVLTALPSQAATISSTTTDAGGGTISPSAYQIDNLLVGSASYDVYFEYGSFYSVYGNPAPASAYSGSFADIIGSAIVEALQDNGIQQIINTAFTSGTLTDFYIPESATGMNSNQHLLAHCFTTRASSPFCDGDNRDPAQSDSVLFARFSESSPTAAIPTPALLPGLLGMGAAVLRRKKQAAEAMNA